MNYLFFFVTVLGYLGLALLTASKPSLSGDSAMGYGLGLAFWGLVFTVGSLALTISLLVKGQLNWVATEDSLRTLIVLVSWLFVVLATFFCAVFKWEWHNELNAYPEFLHWLAVRHGQLWIPLLWLAGCFLAFGQGTQPSVSPQIMKLTFYGGLLLSGIFSTALAVGYLREMGLEAEASLARQQERDDYWHQQVLNDIAAHKPTDPIVNILSQTTQVRPADTRAAALAKVKLHPNWEAEILELLKNKRTYREVYYFLDGNTVSHPEQFAGPLNESIPWLAQTIKENIQDSNNLQSWSFDMYQIDNLLRAIGGQFLNQGIDFGPNVRKLQQALHTTPPERFKDVRFDITYVVDQWVKNYRYKPITPQ